MNSSNKISKPAYQLANTIPIYNHYVLSTATLYYQVLRLLNMITQAELNDDTEYADIKEDVTEECAGYGEILSVLIPR